MSGMELCPKAGMHVPASKAATIVRNMKILPQKRLLMRAAPELNERRELDERRELNEPRP
jgi:hypothetical protein